jgi:hypothetical protein
MRGEACTMIEDQDAVAPMAHTAPRCIRLLNAEAVFFFLL